MNENKPDQTFLAVPSSLINSVMDLLLNLPAKQSMGLIQRIQTEGQNLIIKDEAKPEEKEALKLVETESKE